MEVTPKTVRYLIDWRNRVKVDLRTGCRYPLAQAPVKL